MNSHGKKKTAHSVACGLIEWDQIEPPGDSPGHLVLCFGELCMTWIPMT